MNQDDPTLDQRLLRFEAQLDRFSLALHQWQAGVQAEPAVPREVDQRIRALEETIDREAIALRRMYEEPLKQLQAHAASLKEICAAAVVSVSSLDQAESRLAAIQADVHHHLSDLSRTLQTLVADLRVGASSAALATQGPAAAWPLDRIVHLHDELRRTATEPDSGGVHGTSDAAAPVQARAGFQRSSGEPPVARGPLLGSVVGSEESRHAVVEETASAATGKRTWYIGGALIAAAAVLLFVLELRIETRLNDAGARVAAAERQATAASQAANKEVAAARDEANRQVAEARKSAQRAEIIGAILTAPDLIRFNLTSGTVDRSSAQVLWSRTRGLVLSASRLPAAPPQTTYQLWLKTKAESISAGVFVPDATGRATLVTDALPRIPGPVVDAEVTVEPGDGATVPSGRTMLVRPPQS